MSTRLVVLDRDGVINHDSDAFIRSTADWRAIDGSLEGVALLSEAGFTVAVATNQSGLARGFFGQAELSEIHHTMESAAIMAGGCIDRIVYCPHGPDDGCDCRKPAPGLLLQLAELYGVSLVGVPFIGDSSRDLAAARAVGARPILVRTGKGRLTEASLEDGSRVDVYEDLLEAAQALIAEPVAQGFMR